jgi:hypothetical protein
VSTATVLEKSGKIRLDARGGANPAFFELARGASNAPAGKRPVGVDSALAVLMTSVIRGLLGPGNWFRAPVTVSTPETGPVTFALGRDPSQGDVDDVVGWDFPSNDDTTIPAHRHHMKKPAEPRGSAGKVC